MLGHEAAAIYGQCASLAEDEANRTRAALEKLGEELRALDEERMGAARELAAIYLPELSDGALRTASYYTGLRVFDQRDPLQAMAKEAVRLQQEIVHLEGDERYRDREALVGPMGSLTRALQEAKDYLSPWEEECQRFEVLPHFQELVDIGYDTPSSRSAGGSPRTGGTGPRGTPSVRPSAWPTSGTTCSPPGRRRPAPVTPGGKRCGAPARR